MRHERWRDALFLHYPVDAEALQQRLPEGLTVDTFHGVAYIGVVLLTECGIVPWPPGVPLWLVRRLGLSHHAVNVRTYVRPTHGAGPPGIFFFTLDCSALLPTIGAWLLFNLPYRYARMLRSTRHTNDETSSLRLESTRVRGNAAIAAEWKAEGSALGEDATDAADADADLLGRFFVERYALYNPAGPLLRLLAMIPRLWKKRSSSSSSNLWTGTITHEPWPLTKARLIAYGGICCKGGVLAALGLSELVQGGRPVLAHASSGVGPIDFFWRGMV